MRLNMTSHSSISRLLLVLLTVVIFTSTAHAQRSVCLAGRRIRESAGALPGTPDDPEQLTKLGYDV